MKANYLFLLFVLIPSYSFATDVKVEYFALSHSFSNILPVKQLIEDDWQQSPENKASDGFTQNEMGLRSYWGDFSFGVSQRYDYFVLSNSDTAQTFYLDRSDLALNSQKKYNIDLKLLHQRSNGLRIGYKFEFENFSSEIRLGYWQLSATRESNLQGTLASDLQGNVSAIAQLEEYYSDNNFLHRRNTDDWDTDGSGLTLDIYFAWQPTRKISIFADFKDLYSDFSLNDSGYSKGKIDTEGTFINSVGGIAYLPVYRGISTAQKHQFKLPEQVNLLSLYQYSEQMSYLARYKRQGEQNFYYIGLELAHENSSTRLSFDIENTAPEIQYTSDWFSFVFSIDQLDVDRAMLLNFGVNIHFDF